jgi:putative SOS response-associated peptidase YedK
MRRSMSFRDADGLMVVSAFYEHVALPRPGAEPEKVILEFKRRPQQNMLVACLWSRWSAPGEQDLLSFAAITDEPPPEVAAAGA